MHLNIAQFRGSQLRLYVPPARTIWTGNTILRALFQLDKSLISRPTAIASSLAEALLRRPKRSEARDTAPRFASASTASGGTHAGDRSCCGVEQRGRSEARRETLRLASL